MEDDAARELLEEVTAAWVSTGVLGVLRDLVDQVWHTDLARFDRDLGDDAMSLGMQASRNLCNLTVLRLADVPGVVARDRRTLEITYGDRVLHVGKAPSDSPAWEVTQVVWADSEVREHAAAANSTAYQSSAGTLFEDWPALHGQGTDPTALRHLHLTWQGLADGSTRTWLGFPQLGGHPWYAVLELDDARLGRAGDRPVAVTERHAPAGNEPRRPTDQLPDPPGPEGTRAAPEDAAPGHGEPRPGFEDPPLPGFEDLTEPEVLLTRRTQPGRPRLQGA